MSQEISSPCIGICLLDEHNICTGCFRTQKEIKDWSNLQDEERLQILEAIEERGKQQEPIRIR